MKNIDEITEKIRGMEPNLANVLWEPFLRDAKFVFSDGEEHLHLRTIGVHYFTVRKSMFAGGLTCLADERNVEYFEISNDSPFLRQFLNKEILHIGDIVLYDSYNRPATDPKFVRPFHVNINCTDGTIDVICESLLAEIFNVPG